MSGGFPLGLELSNAQIYGISGSAGTSITNGVNAKGAYVQLTAATTADCCMMLVQIEQSVLSGVSFVAAVDIAVGAGGSEKVIAPDLLCLYNLSATSFLFPVNIPSGTRIAARASGDHAGSTFISVMLFDGSLTRGDGFAGIDSLGFTVGTSLGTVLTSGLANAKGAYSQIVVSTARDYAGIMVGVDTDQADRTDVYLIDIAIGPGGSEQVIIPNLVLKSVGGSLGPAPCPGPFYIPLPAGTRIAARSQAVGAAAIMVLTLYGIYQ